MRNNAFLLFLISVVTFDICNIEYAQAISCYDCHSNNDPRCGVEFVPHRIGIVNCSLRAVPEHITNVTRATLCRKIVQEIYGKIRVIRGCGYNVDAEYDDNKKCLFQQGVFQTSGTYCSCTSDLCNSSTILKSPPVIIAIITIFILSRFFA